MNLEYWRARKLKLTWMTPQLPRFGLTRADRGEQSLRPEFFA